MPDSSQDGEPKITISEPFRSAWVSGVGGMVKSSVRTCAIESAAKFNDPHANVRLPHSPKVVCSAQNTTMLDRDCSRRSMHWKRTIDRHNR